MLKRIVSIVMITGFCLSAFSSTFVMAASFSDVPSSHWASADIEKANSLGIMKGLEDGVFGMGTKVKRGEFASMLTRMFGWGKVTPETPSFTDNADKNAWYYSDIETAVRNGAIKTDVKEFRPNDNITREEIAVMIINALGYNTLAESVKEMGNPFTDVTTNVGHISMAYDFGIISGRDSTVFDPKGTAPREEVAAMMVRAYNKYNSKIDFLHGFYAFSSWSQKDMAGKMDAVSLGWSRLDYSVENGVSLNTTSSNNNEWRIPLGYEEAASYFKAANIPTNLDIFMSANAKVTLADGNSSNICREILLNKSMRSQAVKAILQELTKVYPETGNNIYSGVTIDFENMSGNDLKDAFSDFLRELRSELDKINKSLYVAVHPKVKSSSYYYAYDYYTIGQLADKVILMAHDYQANSMPLDVMGSGFTTTPLTPFDEIYFALRAITDGNSGVQDRSKIVLAISINSVGWSKKDGVVLNSISYKPSISDISDKIKNGAIRKYSEKYRNPYIVYTENGVENVVWYEDSQSIIDKVELAHMFGINGLSIWRIGTIPNYYAETNLDVWDKILAEKKN